MARISSVSYTGTIASPDAAASFAAISAMAAISAISAIAVFAIAAARYR